MRLYTKKVQQSLPALNSTAFAGGSVGAGGIPVSSGEDEVHFQISGTFVGTVLFQGSLDGVAWFDVGCVATITGAIAASSTTPGAWRIVNPPPYMRFVMNPYTSGTALVDISAVLLQQ